MPPARRRDPPLVIFLLLSFFIHAAVLVLFGSHSDETVHKPLVVNLWFTPVPASGEKSGEGFQVKVTPAKAKEPPGGRNVGKVQPRQVQRAGSGPRLVKRGQSETLSSMKRLPESAEVINEKYRAVMQSSSEPKPQMNLQQQPVAPLHNESRPEAEPVSSALPEPVSIVIPEEQVAGRGDTKETDKVSTPDAAGSVGTPQPSLAEKPVNAEFGSSNGPRVLNMPTPKYPLRALRLRLEGRVLVRLELDRSGGLRSASIEKAAGHGFDRSALEAVRQARFAPASRNGRPVACIALLPIVFRLKS